HLMRHPYATIYSFMEAKLDENFFRHQHPFTRRQLAELIWIVSNHNIIKFFKSIPAERQYRIHFENLLHDPERELRDLCDFMQVEFQSEMLEPYKGSKMTDGIHKNVQMVGDFKFYLHKRINVDVAERWRQLHTEDFLSDIAWDLAQELGYEPERELTRSSQPQHEKLAVIRREPRDGQLPLSFAQQRLWFLDQFEPGNPQYNVPVAAHLKGLVDREKLAASLNLIIRRHETLRTTFEISPEGKALQTIHPYQPIKLPLVSLLDIDAQEREREAQKIANAEASRQFDLRTGPLIRVRLIQIAEDEFILVLVMHHIISDGWSANILIRELTAGYEQLCRDETPILAELPVQYADFAVWQRQWLSGDRQEKQLAYWRQKLGDLPALLELPTDRPRTTVSSHRGKEIIFRFSRALTQELKAAAKSYEVTDFMLLLAGFQVLLARYSNQKDIAVGTPIAGRTRREIEPLIGFFVNTLVMRGDLDGNPTFAEFLSQVKKTAVEAYEHQDVPFEKLVDILQPQRDTSHSPLFQVMFALQESSLESIELADLRLSVFQISSGAAKFDMSLSMVEREGQFRGQLEYDSDLFDAHTIEQFIHHFRLLFESIAADQNQRMFDVDILSDQDRTTIIHEFNDVGTLTIPDDALLYDLFEKRAVRTPQQVIILSEHGALTCDQLNKRANQLASYLAKKGLRAEKFAAICMDRSAEMIVGILGILKAGAAYVPMDPDYPAERLSYILNDSGAGIVLTQKHLLDKLPETGAEIICLDEDWDAISQENDGNVRRALSCKNLAYMIYTSGSTGRPKGVTITHQSATALVTWGIENYRQEQVNGFFFSTSICFDVSVFEIFVTLCGHGRLIMGKNALDLPNISHSNQVTLVSMVPSAISQLMRMDAIPASVTTVHLAGEFLSPAIVDQLYQREHIQNVYDLYGPTEDTVYSTHALRQKNAPATIGKPLKGKKIYVLDAAFNPVPVGVAGEMFIGGIGLARGYHQQPDLTAEKFIPDPFSQTGGERIYRTGDLVRYHHDGKIEYLGRIDHQVKIRGYRIELGEIETTLRRFPQIRDVAVVVYEEIPGDKRLVAYYTFQKEKPTVEELRAFLHERLPEYMVPSYFVSMEELPRTPNGKLNRKALPRPHINRSDLSSVYSAAHSEVEKLLSQIWQGVLNVEQVGIDDNFFALGGDSILSIQVLARARQHGIFISPKEFFNQPTIRGLAVIAGDVHRIEAEQGRVVGEAPVSSIQRSFFAQNLKQRNHWNQSLLLDVDEPFDPAALQAAVEALLAHHDMLRSGFVEEENEWKLRIVENIDQIPLRIFNLETSDETEQRAFIEKVMAEHQNLLDIQFGPICQFVCINLPIQSRWRLGIIIHHLAVDGV
ncbi:MAG: amino acid adenylation domain-containing protein, partial [Calditrichaeota bacterium]